MLNSYKIALSVKNQEIKIPFVMRLIYRSIQFTVTKELVERLLRLKGY